MKKIFRLILGLGLAFGLSSCDAMFDNMEGDLSKMTGDDMLSSEAGVQRVLANLYSNLPMGAFSTNDQNTLFANGSRSTPSYTNSVTGFWNYDQIRVVNMFIENLHIPLENKVITQETHDSYMGEALAIRAYYYFAMVRVYGGIPIVETTLDDKYDGGDNAGLYIERSTEKETWDWVIDQFQAAADILPNVSDRTMAINKYTALGLKARAALWAASLCKYWDRAPINSNYNAVKDGLTFMDSDWADDYYQIASDAAKAVIDSGQYSLYGGTEPTSVDAAQASLETLFQTYQPTEGLFGMSTVTGEQNGNGVHNWTAGQFVSTYQQGTYSVTLNFADEFDNYVSETDRSRADGKIVTKKDGNENYNLMSPEKTYFLQVNDDEKKTPNVAKNQALIDQLQNDYVAYDSPDAPFALKDARFKAWVLYPGAPFLGETTNIQGGIITNDVPGKVIDPETRKEVDGIVTYAGAYVYPVENLSAKVGNDTYYAYGSATPSATSSAFYRINLDKNSTRASWYSFMIKKYVDINNKDNKNTQTPWYDLRYAEILLTYAEAYAEANIGEASVAKKALNDIRKRAGFTDEVEPTIENIMHEWKVEFAFESQWPSVLYRRRAYKSLDGAATFEEGTATEKYTLIPMVDVTGEKAQYIFLRAVPYSSTTDWENYARPELGVTNESYYQNVRNFNVNRIPENNK